MKSYASIVIICICTCFCACSGYSDSAHDLSVALRKCYSQYLDAVETGDVEAWERLTSGFAATESKNFAVSSGQTFGSAYLKSIAPFICQRSLDGLKQLTVKQKGDAAKLILYGIPSTEQNANNPQVVASYHVIDFVRQHETWRVHFVSGFLPGQVPGAEKATAEDDYSDLLSLDLFDIADTFPAIPREVPSIDERGVLLINTGGYKTQVWINGYNQCPRLPIVDASNMCPVIGGLNSGTNTIRIAVEKMLGESCYGKNVPDYSITVKVVCKGNPIRKVFEYSPGIPPLTHEASFTITREDF